MSIVYEFYNPAKKTITQDWNTHGVLKLYHKPVHNPFLTAFNMQSARTTYLNDADSLPGYLGGGISSSLSFHTLVSSRGLPRSILDESIAPAATGLCGEGEFGIRSFLCQAGGQSTLGDGNSGGFTQCPYGIALVGLFRIFLESLRRYKHKASTASITRPVNPPTTPPAMGPTGGEDREFEVGPPVPGVVDAEELENAMTGTNTLSAVVYIGPVNGGQIKECIVLRTVKIGQRRTMKCNGGKCRQAAGSRRTPVLVCQPAWVIALKKESFTLKSIFTLVFSTATASSSAMFANIGRPSIHTPESTEVVEK
ncbi:hypothetical protein L218DRAFT_947047 [Marasmius fiardii PR-910]|nr:hypothetical protein L218DRAFT_947047 [Marasmius fiardii PR-910]